jgi:DNA repair photolyase
MGEQMEPIEIRGRGSASNPKNRFERLEYAPDPEARDPEDPGPRTVLLRDTTRTILARNDSPDVGFDVSINPYRGCEHGCIYCYARPTHEYLGFSAGLDFESRILVKERAPALLRSELSSRRWRPEPIGLSGVTDPYQPVERRLRVTRGCLEVLVEFRNPVAVITKNHLVTRDIDLLGELARFDAVVVNLSVTTLDESLQRVMEPRTSTPRRRLQAIESLAAAGIPVGVMVAPVIPGLTDHELPTILAAAAEHGARLASFIPLRLPGAVAALFESWLETHFADRKEKVLGRIREIRSGRLNDPEFGSRMRGTGEYADQLRALFRSSCRRLGLNLERAELSTAAFVHCAGSGQLELL